VQVNEDLAVGKRASQPVCGVYRESGLADPRHPVDRTDHHRRRTVTGREGEYPVELGAAAGERRGVGG
jgi:hypothetical protein